MDIRIHHTGSTGNLFQIDDLLIDPGVTIKKIKEALNYKLSSVAGCLISHSHGDHCKGVNEVMKAGTDCYMSFETAQEINASGHRANIITPGKQFKIGGWDIKPFELVHDVMNLGFLMVKNGEKVLFATDTSYIPLRFKGLNYILLSVDFDLEQLKENVDLGHLHSSLAKRIIKSHLSLQTALDFFRANDMTQVQEIYILHLSSLNSNPEYFREEIQKATGRPVILIGD